jgi:superfamily II DNA or RNA helicase
MPPSKKTFRGKYSRLRPHDTSIDPRNGTEQQLHGIQGRLAAGCDEIERRSLITQAVKLLYRFEAHSGQIDCISWMLQEKRDLILVAKTSFGKSLIMQVLPCLVPHSITLIVLPLLALGFEQEEKIRSLGRFARPVFVHGDNVNSPNLLQDIQHGRYTHILSSPELFTGRRFRPLFRDPTFRGLVKWIVVDELHLVSTWGREFRKSYALLQGMRHVLGSKPWFGCTATLDDPTLRKVCDFAAFKETTEIKRFPIDRPDVAIVRAVVKRLDKTSFKLLHFVVADAARRRDGSRLTSKLGFHQLKESGFQLGPPESQLSYGSQASIFCTPYRSSSLRWTDYLTPDSFSQPSQTPQSPQPSSSKRARSIPRPDALPSPGDLIPSPECIPKTLIFTNSRTGCCKMADDIRKWLQRLGYSETCSEETVRPYYSTMIEVDKKKVLDRFAKTNTELRILIATDALAHGKDIPDVDIVIVYGFPRDKDPSLFLQMFGRAARAPERKGIAILIGDDWAVGECEVRIRRPAMSKKSQQECDQDSSSVISENDFGSNTFLSSSSLPSDAPLPSSPPRIMNMDTLVSRTACKMKTLHKTNVDKRAELPRAIWDFMNVGVCLRRVFLRWFREPELPPDYPREWCCSNCNPALDMTDVELDVGEGSVVQPDDHNPEFETKLRKWLQSWIDIHIQQYDYPPVPEYLFSRRHITEIARSSFPLGWHAIHKFLKTAAGFTRLGEDAEKLINFIMEEKAQISHLTPRSQPSVERTLQTPVARFRGAKKREALVELDVNVTPMRKRVK